MHKVVNILITMETSEELVAAVDLLKSYKIIKRDREVAERTGYDKSVVSSYLSGRVKPSKNFVDKFQEVFKESLQMKSKVLPSKPTGIPYLGELDIFAGQADIANADLSEYITEFISIPGFKDANYFVNVRGSSMYPKYVPGEIIAIKLCKDINEIQYGQAYVVITNENRVLKYVRKPKNGNGHLILASANGDYDPYEIEKSKIKAMFLVLGKITKDVL